MEKQNVAIIAQVKEEIERTGSSEKEKEPEGGRNE